MPRLIALQDITISVVDRVLYTITFAMAIQYMLSEMHTKLGFIPGSVQSRRLQPHRQNN